MSKKLSRVVVRPQRAGGLSQADASILLIDDDPGAIQLLGRILVDVGKLRFATNGRDALRLARESTPDLILLDAQMPDISGFQLFETLMSESQLSAVPVIFVTSHSEAGFETSAFEMGAADFITKPLRASVVLARVKTHLRMKQMADELRRNATTDELTGVASRRQFDETLAREWLRGLRNADPISLLLVNVDGFSSFNERYGRPKGDDTLRHIARTLSGACQRPADLLARCGGDEFMALLPQTARPGAEHVANRILAAIAALGISHEDCPPSHRLSVSVGVACYDERSVCWVHRPEEHRLHDDLYAYSAASDLVLAADEALRAAKKAGRARASVLDIAELDGADAERASSFALASNGLGG